MKRILFFVITCMILLSGYGCKQSITENQTDPYVARRIQSGKSIGFSVAGFAAPYFSVLIDYAKLEALENDVYLYVKDAKWNTVQQSADIDEFIGLGVDAICVIPIDSKQIIPSFEKVKKADIPLIDVNVQHDPQAEGLIDCFVGASMTKQAAMAAESLMGLMKEDDTNIIMLEGAAGNFATIGRAKGFEEMIAGTRFKIIGRAYTGWEKDKAEEIMKEMLEKYDDIDALYAHDDDIAIGAIQAIKASGRAGEFPIVSISGNIDGYEAIKRGEILSTVSQPPDWEGIMAIRVAIDLMEGREVKKWIETPVALVTKENVSEYKGLW